jgi:hypothetical protein
MDSLDSPRPGLGGATTFHHIVYSTPLHGGHIQMAFCPRTPATLRAHNFFCKPLIAMRSKAKLEPSSRAFQRYVARRLNASKSGRFPTFSGRESSLTPDPSFAHNLCCGCPNGSCEAIFDIYTSRPFPMV